MTRKILITLIAALALSASAFAQTRSTAPVSPAIVASAATTPALTAEQKLALQNAALALQNAALAFKVAQLEAQAAAHAHAQASTALQQLLAASTPAGYVINERLELVKMPEKKAPDTQ